LNELNTALGPILSYEYDGATDGREGSNMEVAVNEADQSAQDAEDSAKS